MHTQDAAKEKQTKHAAAVSESPAAPTSAAAHSPTHAASVAPHPPPPPHATPDSVPPWPIPPPPSFNAAAAAAAAALTGVPPVAPDTVVEVIAVPTESGSTKTVLSSASPSPSPCPPGASSSTSAANASPQKVLSQSPPAGMPLPFPRTHLVWMANGEQSSIDELFFTPKTADHAAIASAAPAPASAPAATAAADATVPTASPAAAASASPASAVPPVTPFAASASVVPPPRPRTVLVVGFVGAFLSLCQEQLPPFSLRWSEFRARGVDSILAVSVNDHAVLKSFAQQAQLDLSKIGLIADHDASFVRALHLGMDLSAAGMGWRAKRFVMVVREGVVDEAWVEDNPGQLTVSSADSVLQRLPILPEFDEAAVAARKKKDKKTKANAKAEAVDNESAAAVAIPMPSAPSASASAPSSAAASAAATVVAAVRGLSAAVSDRLDGTTDAADAIAKEAHSGAAAGEAAAAATAEDDDGPSLDPATVMTDVEREEAARRVAAEQTPPGQA